MPKRNSLEDVLRRAKELYGNKYDYSNIKQYESNKVNYEIICNDCGSHFFINFDRHLNRKQGCKVCSIKNRAIKRSLGIDKFIEKARLIHRDKYDYSNIKYVNYYVNIDIFCNKCQKYFKQSPSNHIAGKGCPYCYGNAKSNTAEFISKAIKIHGDNYDYSNVKYVNCHSKVDIVCKKCNSIFSQTPASHLRYAGCPNCTKYKGEIRIANYLINNNICLKEDAKSWKQKRYSDLFDKGKLSYDFFIEKYNLLIEYNGIQHYDKNSFGNYYDDFLLQKHHDWLKRRYAIKNNINLLVIPYWEFDNIEKIIDETIDKISRNCYNSVKGVK